eukprot:Ihof_evm7s312 gene=Ihof_evmTU7s312
MKRVETTENEAIQSLLQKLGPIIGHQVGTFSLHKEGESRELPSRGASVKALGLRHGDILVVTIEKLSSTREEELVPKGKEEVKKEEMAVVEDTVDVLLTKESGLIKREKQSIGCRHGPNGMCENCVPLEPYDGQYLTEKGIKHLSFHSWIRKQTGGLDKGKFSPLSDLQCTITPGCAEHPPWPNGICTKCQPSAVTLNRQAYRHVDYVEFESPVIVEQFLSYWRSSGGCQRIGMLYGRYEMHKEVPLGIKAVVSAIYEPPQWSNQVALQLLDDPNSAIVDRVAAMMGLTQVGWVFTDLEDDGTNTGKVMYKRHKDTYFLTSYEVLLAAELQISHPNPTKLAANGRFGSKYVTIAISGTSTNEVGISAYQVSNQAMALVRDDCLRSSKKNNMMRAKKSSNQQYIPDIFYTYKNEYNTDVTATASPDFPLEYLIVNVASGSPQAPSPLFHSALPGTQSFAIENRSAIGEVQAFSDLSSHLAKAPTFLAAMSDFHLLLFLSTNTEFDLGNDLAGLCQALATQDSGLANLWRQQPGWQHVEMLMAGT